MVGLISLCANSVFTPQDIERMPHILERARVFGENHPELFTNIHRPGVQSANGNYLISLLTEDRLRRVLSRMLDEKEFLGPYGIRSLSKVYENPYTVQLGGQSFSIQYAPAESLTNAFGGNSNWRGPVWFPINALIYRALLNLYAYYGDDFKVECPTGSGKLMNLYEVSAEIASRLSNTFLQDKNGRRPVLWGFKSSKQILTGKTTYSFYEYFHGDNGAGLGASHQTGWTGLVALLLKLKSVDTSQAITKGRQEVFRQLVTQQK